MSETPMMKQYQEIKSRYQEEILFFRLGDFYEMFHDDAREASSILNLTLTARNSIPMCGIPFHAAKNYVKRLLMAGKKVAICEQVTLPEAGKGIVKREVTQILTPGTVVDEDLLPSSANNYILSVAILTKERVISLSFADVSTGEFTLKSVEMDNGFTALRRTVARLQPAEMLIQESEYFENASFKLAVDNCNTMITRFPDWQFDPAEAERVLREHFNSASLKQFGIERTNPVLHSAGILMTYLQHTSKQLLAHITTLNLENETDLLVIDESSQKNLELVRNLQDGGDAYTLYSAIRDTRTAAGNRLLKRWILTPLSSRQQIEARQLYVDLFYHDQLLHNRIRKEISGILDLERLSSRVALRKALPRDLLSIGHSLSAVYTVSSLHETITSYFLRRFSREELDALFALAEILIDAIHEQVSGPFAEGRVIRDGFNKDLDEARSFKDESETVIRAYRDALSTETGIPKIKIKQNKILGYFIEVSKTHSSSVPESFIRKQTLVNGERFTTEELIRIERRILMATDEAESLERSLYDLLMQQVYEAGNSIRTAGAVTAEIDLFQSFAHSAVRYGYTKPVFEASAALQIINGRHPVVEQHIPPGEFVPNSLEFSPSNGTFALITGPNMSGKSTFLRQNAMIVVMAQMGAYVPADTVIMDVQDRLFCRVGATDNLARGESTFLVEMIETAFILRHATPNSLVIMDEVGRGTSSEDGAAIAFAVMKQLLSLRAKTLFATHYHELTLFADKGLQQLFLEVDDREGKIVFRNRVLRGSSPSSYGLHVARLAGVPAKVVRMAEEYQKLHVQHEKADVQAELQELFVEEEPLFGEQFKPDDDVAARIMQMLDVIDIDNITPREALEFLYRLLDMKERN